MIHHCHCKFEEKRKKLSAGKFGIFGGVLVVAHLLYHVAEFLVLPVFLLAAHRDDAEASEVDADFLQETTFYQPDTSTIETSSVFDSGSLQISLFESLQKYSLRP